MKKTKKSTKEWLEAIQTCKKSGLSVKRWCSENGCSLKSYYYWHKKLFFKPMEITHSPCFEELPFPKTELGGDSPFQIHVGTFRIEISHSATRQELTDLLKAVVTLC